MQEGVKMEFVLSCKGSAEPCEVTFDHDNGRYMLRKADRSGEFFNTPQQLVEWIEENWTIKDFYDPEEFIRMVNEIKNNL